MSSQHQKKPRGHYNFQVFCLLKRKQFFFKLTLTKNNDSFCNFFLVVVVVVAVVAGVAAVLVLLSSHSARFWSLKWKTVRLCYIIGWQVAAVSFNWTIADTRSFQLRRRKSWCFYGIIKAWLHQPILSHLICFQPKTWQCICIIFLIEITTIESPRQGTWLTRLDPWPEIEGTLYWVSDWQVELYYSGLLPMSSINPCQLN